MAKIYSNLYDQIHHPLNGLFGWLWKNVITGYKASKADGGYRWKTL
jgi:hypothetical protein